MHVFISGIGGTAMAALAILAKQAGYEVSGSDARPSEYLEYLKQKGIDQTAVTKDADLIAKIQAEKPIDWYVYGSAQPRDFPDHPEFEFCKQHGIKMSKRDEFLTSFIKDRGLKLIAVAGTHGKTTTTAMAVWLLKELGLPVSYSVGGKISFGDISQFDPDSQYFVYEADEYDRNFLAFESYLSLVTGVDWDHPDIYPTREDYYDAFRDFLAKSQQAVIWQGDAERLGIKQSDHITVLDEQDVGVEGIKLAGLVNRQNAWQVANALQPVVDKPLQELLEVMDRFPGLSRRFEEIAPKVYSDYAHTPGKIRGALQMAQEIAGDNVVVIYEGLHNLRQHFIKEDLATLFDQVKQLYIVPSYLGREDPKQKLLSPADLLNMLSIPSKKHAQAAELNDQLKQAIEKNQVAGDLVLCLTAGGPGSLDEWLRREFKS